MNINESSHNVTTIYTDELCKMCHSSVARNKITIATDKEIKCTILCDECAKTVCNYYNIPFNPKKSKNPDNQKTILLALICSFCILLAVLLGILIISGKNKENRETDISTSYTNYSEESYSEPTSFENEEIIFGTTDASESKSTVSVKTEKATKSTKSTTANKDTSGLIKKDIICNLKPNQWVEYQLEVSSVYGKESNYEYKNINFYHVYNEFDPDCDSEPHTSLMGNICIEGHYENGAYRFNGRVEGSYDSCSGYMAGYLKKVNDTYHLHLDRFELGDGGKYSYETIYTFPLDLEFKEGKLNTSGNYQRKSKYERIWSNEDQSFNEWDDSLYYRIDILRLDSQYIVFNMDQVRAYGFNNIRGYKQSDGSYKFYGDDSNSSYSRTCYGTVKIDNDKVIVNIEYFKDSSNGWMLRTNTNLVFKEADY